MNDNDKRQRKKTLDSRSVSWQWELGSLLKDFAKTISKILTRRKEKLSGKEFSPNEFVVEDDSMETSSWKIIGWISI